MPHNIGVDIIEIARIEEAISRWGDRFLERVYTQAEMAYCRGRVSELAARFAGKEAVMKALALGRFWREEYKDYGWSYPFPTTECSKIAGLVCFYNEFVDLFDDGELLERPTTVFSKAKS